MQKYLGDVTEDIAAYHPSLEMPELAPAFKAYAAANDGHFPNTPADLQPYVTTPQQQAAFQKLKQFYP